MTQYMSATRCTVCNGKRLRPESLAVKLAGHSIAEFTALSLKSARPAVAKILGELTQRQHDVAGRPLEEVAERLDFLLAVGLGYLSLDRSAATLSGGEAQRIRLATQIGSRLRGVLYVLDEPSIGLHARDNDRLLGSLEQLRNLGNTVLVVEHDEDTIRRADFVVDLGPGAGEAGGHLVAQGKPEQVAANPESLTGQYLSGATSIPVPAKRRSPNGKAIQILGAHENNLKDVDFTLPLGLLTVVTGVSGSGKSTLVNDILYRALAQKLYRSMDPPGAHKSVTRHRAHRQSHRDRSGADRPHATIESGDVHGRLRSDSRTLRDAARIARARLQTRPLQLQREGRTLRGLPGRRASPHRNEFSARRLRDVRSLPRPPLQLRNARGALQGPLDFRRAEYAGDEALKLLENIPAIQQKLATLVEVGLGYVQLGQSATTLSGGEAQRIKLARELSKRQTGRTLYILDEPTTGLHFDDVRKLLDVLQRLVSLGNTVLIIEHHLDVIKQADWIIDLGPEGGEGGGRIVAQGSPEQVARNKKSYTGSGSRAHAAAQRRQRAQFQWPYFVEVGAISH